MRYKPTKYKLRAECPTDTARLLLTFAEANINVPEFSQVQHHGHPDVELVFSTVQALDDLYEVIRRLPDSHVMLETIAPFDEYTGERDASIR